MCTERLAGLAPGRGFAASGLGAAGRGETGAAAEPRGLGRVVWGGSRGGAPAARKAGGGGCDGGEEETEGERSQASRPAPAPGGRGGGRKRALAAERQLGQIRVGGRAPRARRDHRPLGRTRALPAREVAGRSSGQHVVEVVGEGLAGGVAI